MLLKRTLRPGNGASYRRSAPFILPYLALLLLINIFGTKAFSPLDPNDHIFRNFFYFWHSSDGTTGLLTWITATNCLVVLYLWVEFRSFRIEVPRDWRAAYLYFVGCALTLMFFQHFYLRLSAIEPIYNKVHVYDLRTPVAQPIYQEARPARVARIGQESRAPCEDNESPSQ
ncbi:MAG: hypothetical protein AAF560_10720 [Acidobacteriota bacterium]